MDVHRERKSNLQHFGFIGLTQCPQGAAAVRAYAFFRLDYIPDALEVLRHLLAAYGLTLLGRSLSFR